MDDRLVPRDSAVYREFARLYRLARGMRPTGVDRWNGDLYATDTERWGGLDPKTGSIRLSDTRALQQLTGSTSKSAPRQQAQALATVLHEATHAGMETDAPTEPNAVRGPHSRGTMEGFAELRATHDFADFAVIAGYPGLKPPTPAYAGAHQAVDNLVTQVSGPAKDRFALIAEASRGPAVMHFDQLADAVVRNRLAEVVPDRAEDRTAVRAALIKTMMHNQWPTLPDRPAAAGALVAEDVRRGLNAKVDEIGRHYRANPTQPFPAEAPNAVARVQNEQNDRTGRDVRGLPPPDVRTRVTGVPPPVGANPELRFLDGQAPAAGAARRPTGLGNGAERAGAQRASGISRRPPGERDGRTDR